MHIEKASNSFFHWFSGFTAGEGCFYIHSAKRTRRDGTTCNTYRPRFQIKLRDDDTPIIETVARTLGFGRFSKTSQHGRSKPCRTFEVYKIEDMLKLVPIFDTYPLRNKKQDDYGVWREAVLWLENSPKGTRYTGPRDWSKLKEFKDRLEKVRAYKPR